MEVILINPSFDSSRVGPLHKYVPAQLPLSLGYLAGYLLERDIEPNIIDGQLEYLSPEKIRRLVSAKVHLLVGLTCLTAGAKRAYQLAGWIKEANPNAIIVFGGIHTTVMPDEALKKGYADVAVRHEGEETLYELIKYYRTGGNLEDIKGASFRSNGKIVHNPDRPLIKDLDRLPLFPYHLFKDEVKRYDFGNIMISRGCPFECIFCSQRSISGRFYRYRSAKNVIKELDMLIYEYGQKRITFNDDNFIINREPAIELCETIIKRGYPKDVSFSAGCRADKVDINILKLMKRAGFAIMAYGLETGSERLMKIVKKRETVDDNKKAVQLTHQAGIMASGSFILGLPTETKEESLQTVRFAKSLPMDLTRFNLLVPYPGTEAYGMIKKDMDIKDNDWTNFLTVSGFGKDIIPYVPKGRTQEEMRRLQLWANLSFYLRPRQFFILLRQGFSNQLRLPKFPSLKAVMAYIEIALYLVIAFVRTFIKNNENSSDTFS